MKAIVVMDQAAGTAGVKLVERPEPQAAINDVVVQIHASGFTGDELSWPSTWTDRVGRDRAVRRAPAGRSHLVGGDRTRQQNPPPIKSANWCESAPALLHPSTCRTGDSSLYARLKPRLD
jgi:hypothetical protein